LHTINILLPVIIGVHSNTGYVLAASLGARVVRHPLHLNNTSHNGSSDLRSLQVAAGKLSSLYMDDERIISGYARDINVIDWTL
jgi:hypothetical protein